MGLKDPPPYFSQYPQRSIVNSKLMEDALFSVGAVHSTPVSAVKVIIREKLAEAIGKGSAFQGRWVAEKRNSRQLTSGDPPRIKTASEASPRRDDCGISHLDIRAAQSSSCVSPMRTFSRKAAFDTEPPHLSPTKDPLKPRRLSGYTAAAIPPVRTPCTA